MRKSVQITGVVLLLLFIVTVAVWYALSREERRGSLTVSFLSVGQGEAILIDAPSGAQILIDGGPDSTALRRLGSAMPPWDRSLDIVIATSPDTSTVSGLIDVLQRYSVDTILQSGVQNTSQPWNLFEKEIVGKKIITAKRGQLLDLGSTGSPEAAHAYLQILFPDRAVPGAAAAEGCVVSRLTYGAASFLFACNATAGVQNYLAALDGQKIKSDVLGIYSTPSPIFSAFVAPQYIASSSAVTFVSDGQTVSER